MKKRIRDLWIKALRSGKYKKGVDHLCTINENGSRSYCCLGVLTELAIKDGVKIKKDVINSNWPRCSSYINYTGPEDSMYSYLLRSVMKWAGLHDFDPLLRPETSRSANIMASEINDNGNVNTTFRKIADLIEKNIPAE